MLKKIILLILAISLGGCGDDSGESNSPAASFVNNRVVDRDMQTFDVTNKFGALNVMPGEFSYDSGTKPWSSWWYPTIDGDLFDDVDGVAPLLKYDEYVLLRHNQIVDSANYEQNVLFNPQQASWAGLCHAWAVASLLHKEPSRVISKEGILFSVADQKALLLKSYENVSKLDIYGKRYDGLHDNEFQDIYPDQFHRFLVHHLKEQGKPFIMDYDPSYPVWTVPVYLAKTKIQEVDSQTMSVTTWVTYASPFVEKNFVGTRHIVKAYHYNLYGSWNSGVFNVIDSEWTNSSLHDHPDYVIGFPENAVRGSYNKEFHVNRIDEILKK